MPLYIMLLTLHTTANVARGALHIMCARWATGPKDLHTCPGGLDPRSAPALGILSAGSSQQQVARQLGPHRRPVPKTRNKMSKQSCTRPGMRRAILRIRELASGRCDPKPVPRCARLDAVATARLGTRIAVRAARFAANATACAVARPDLALALEAASSDIARGDHACGATHQHQIPIEGHPPLDEESGACRKCRLHVHVCERGLGPRLGEMVRQHGFVRRHPHGPNNAHQDIEHREPPAKAPHVERESYAWHQRQDRRRHDHVATVAELPCQAPQGALQGRASERDPRGKQRHVFLAQLRLHELGAHDAIDKRHRQGETDREEGQQPDPGVKPQGHRPCATAAPARLRGIAGISGSDGCGRMHGQRAKGGGQGRGERQRQGCGEGGRHADPCFLEGETADLDEALRAKGPKAEHCGEPRGFRGQGLARCGSDALRRLREERALGGPDQARAKAAEDRATVGERVHLPHVGHRAASDKGDVLAHVQRQPEHDRDLAAQPCRDRRGDRHGRQRPHPEDH
mmetsp:Transcript_76579/g.234460  ORF Transcript_76579/g.234460 Transcript_76579/m.234460 type:complete len:518 (+) Transcript_76579:67-1620(+)